MSACYGSDPQIWTDAYARTHQTNAMAAAICATCEDLLSCGRTAERLRKQIPSARLGTEFRPYGIWAGLLYDGSGRPPVRLTSSGAVVGGEAEAAPAAQRWKVTA